jgi:hypothetical protein
VHKETIAVAVAEVGKNDAQVLGVVPKDGTALRTLMLGYTHTRTRAARRSYGLPHRTSTISTVKHCDDHGAVRASLWALRRRVPSEIMQRRRQEALRDAEIDDPDRPTTEFDAADKRRPCTALVPKPMKRTRCASWFTQPRVTALGACRARKICRKR